MTLQVGAQAPDFVLPSTSGELRFRELISGRQLVLAFYAEASTPLCSSEVTLLKVDYELVRELGAEVLAISADGLEAQQEFARRLGGLPFPLASDERLEAAEAYGVVDETGRRSRRAVFVIDREGEIVHVEPWFQPGNPSQYESIFRALGFDAE